jgi:hypothetical protein
MQTDDLIAALSTEVAPVPRRWTARQVTLGTVLGLAGAIFLWIVFFGPREDLPDAIRTWPFWMKFLYTGGLSAGGLWLLVRLGKPGAALSLPVMAAAAPVALAGLAAMLVLSVPEEDALGLILGHSAATCTVAIPLLSLPALAASFWVLRQLAPTRLALAGAGAGFLAGSEAAFLYAFYCTEDAAPFVAVWYTIGILLTASLGAFLGRSLLRW